jgi:hypothetical protein
VATWRPARSRPGCSMPTIRHPSRAEPALVAVAQPVAAFGGSEAEDIPAARPRALTALAQPDKAVTLADYERWH